MKFPFPAAWFKGAPEPDKPRLMAPDWCVLRDDRPGRSFVCTLCGGWVSISLSMTRKQTFDLSDQFIRQHTKCGGIEGEVRG